MKDFKTNILVPAVVAALVIFAVSKSPHNVSAFQQEDVKALFEKMRESRLYVSYTGEVEVERQFRDRKRIQKKRVAARPPKEYSEEFVLSPEDEERFRRFNERRQQDNTHLRGIRSWNNRGQFRRNSEVPFQVHGVQLDLLRQNYEVTIEKSDPVAGRETTLISIVPRYEMRPANRLWVDRETGVILKRELSESGQENGRIYRETFTAITYEETDREAVDKMFKERRDSASVKGGRRRHTSREYKKLDDISDRIRSGIVIPGSIPDGFVLDMIRVSRERRSMTFHQVYTDGLLLFSLFQSQGGPRDQFSGQGRMGRFRGAPNQVMLQKSDGDTNFVLFGTMRSDLLKPVLDSLPGKEMERKRH